MTRYNLHNLYNAKIKEREKISGSTCSKEVYEIIFDIKSANMEFIPGDCLGVMPQNDPSLVKKCLKILNKNPDEKIIIKNESITLFDFLLKKVNFSKVKLSFLNFVQIPYLV